MNSCSIYVVCVSWDKIKLQGLTLNEANESGHIYERTFCHSRKALFFSDCRKNDMFM